MTFATGGAPAPGTPQLPFPQNKMLRRKMHIPAAADPHPPPGSTRKAFVYILFPLQNKVFKPSQRCAQVVSTLCDPMDCSPPGSSVHGILQARILEGVAIPFSRGSSQPRDQTQVSNVSYTGRRFFTTSTAWEAPSARQDSLFFIAYGFIVMCFRMY